MRSKIGQLIWVTGQTRSDTSYETCELGNKLKNGKVENIVLANNIIRSLKTQDVCLLYESLGDDSSLKLVAYADDAIFLMVEVKDDTLYFLLIKIDHVLYQAGSLRKYQELLAALLQQRLCHSQLLWILPSFQIRCSLKYT